MTKPSPRYLMSAQEVVASAFADQGVTVLFDAEVPYVDLTSKVMHLRPLPEDLTDEAVEDVRSDCDHELGHIRHTDNSAFDQIKRPIVHLIANSIEDGRIERLMAEEWFGCGENLERSGARAIARIAAAATQDITNRRCRVLCALSLIAYGRPLDDVVTTLGEDTRPSFVAIADLIPAIVNANTTKAVVDLAEMIADRWKWSSSDQPSQTADPLSGALDDEEEAVARLISRESTSVAEARKVSVKSIPTTPLSLYRRKTDRDTVEVIRTQPDALDLFSYFFESIRRIVPTLRRRLLMDLRSPGQALIRHRRRGKLDDRVLHRVPLNDDRVFVGKTPALIHKASITLLIDCSRSMTNPARPAARPDEAPALRSKLFVAAQAAAAMSWVLDHLRIRHECLAYTTCAAPAKHDENYERVRPIRHLIVKPSDRSYHGCRKNFVSLALYGDCAENIDGEAVLWGAQRLLKFSRSDALPVLIVFSDGEPASNPEDHQVLASHLQTSIAKVERAGVDVLGVGIASDAVKRFYRHHVVINDASSLVERFYDLLRILIQERTVRRIHISR